MRHFLHFGGREGRNPSERFDSQHYLRSNPDVAAAAVNPLLHFLTQGKREGRLARRPLSTASSPTPAESYVPTEAPLSKVAIVMQISEFAELEAVWEIIRPISMHLDLLISTTTGNRRQVEEWAAELDQPRAIKVYSARHMTHKMNGLLLHAGPYLRSYDLICHVAWQDIKDYREAREPGSSFVKNLLSDGIENLRSVITLFQQDKSLGLVCPRFSVVSAPLLQCSQTEHVASTFGIASDVSIVRLYRPSFWARPSALDSLLALDPAATFYNSRCLADIGQLLEQLVLAAAGGLGFQWRQYYRGESLAEKAVREDKTVELCQFSTGFRSTLDLCIFPHTQRKAESQKVLTILLNYNCSGEIAAAIASINMSKGIQTDIVVVDNNSLPEEQNALREVLKSHPGVKVIWTPDNLGYASGNNLGLSYGLENGYEFQMILNPDARITATTLYRLVEFFEGHSDLGAVVPLIYRGSTEAQIWCAGTVIDPETGLPINIGSSEICTGPLINRNLDAVSGCCVLLESRCLSEVGLLPEDYFLYFEDTDWSERARRKGWRLAININAQAYHHQTSTGGEGLPKSHYLYYFLRNRIRFVRHWYPDCFSRFLLQHSEFVEAYRHKVQSIAPSKIQIFNELVEQAIFDGLSGVSGKRDLKELELGN